MAITYGNPVTSTTYVGRVLAVYSRDYRAMSDVYTLATFALVCEDDGSIKEHLVNANFECDVSCGHAVVDADAVSLAHKAAHDARIAADAKAREAAYLQERLEAERNRPVKGKKMQVTRGRKVPVGTIGVVAFVHGDRVLLKDEAVWEDRKANGVWVPPQYLKAV